LPGPFDEKSDLNSPRPSTGRGRFWVRFFGPLFRLFSRSARKRACQCNRRYVTRRTARFLRIVSQIFLYHANDLNGGHSPGHAGHPVPSRNIEQLPIHQESIRKACNPPQTGSIRADASRASVPLTAYAGTGFQEVAAGSADIWLLRCALLTRNGGRTNKASAGTRTNKKERKQCSNKK
jgi:hypothetical protein